MEKMELAYKPIHELVQMQKTDVHWTLHASGQPCICPFQPAVPTAGQNGQMAVGRGLCNTGCPLAKVLVDVPEEEETDPIRGTLMLHCGSGAITHAVTFVSAGMIDRIPPIVRL